jgi:hypothetical protein
MASPKLYKLEANGSQSQISQTYPQAQQEMSYSAVGLVRPFLFLSMYSLDYVLDLHRNFIIWTQTSHILNFKTNSLVNFHDSVSRSASQNKHYSRHLHITDTACIKAYTLQTQPQINGNVSRIHMPRHAHKPEYHFKSYIIRWK